MLADAEHPPANTDRPSTTGSERQSAVDAALRAVAAADHLAELERKRVADALARLDDLYEPIRRRRDHLDVGLSRLNGLRSSMVARLDALTPDADLEPTLCHPGAMGSDALEYLEDEPTDSDLSWGGDYAYTNQAHLSASVEGDDNVDNEPSLSAVLMQGPYDQTGARWLGGFTADDREDEHDGREPDVDAEPDADDEASLSGTVGTLWQHAVGGQTSLPGISTVDYEGQCEDEGADSDREPCEHD